MLNAQKELRIFTTSVNNDPKSKSVSPQPTVDQMQNADGAQQ